MKNNWLKEFQNAQEDTVYKAKELQLAQIQRLRQDVRVIANKTKKLLVQCGVAADFRSPNFVKFGINKWQ